MAVTVLAQQGDSLDLLCWRVRGATAGVVEAALELNRNLADGGALLAEGQAVLLPDPAPAAPQTLETVNLWD